MGGWSETRKDMLDKKYAFVDDDAANAPADKKKIRPKKANHKHEYKPILIDAYSKYTGRWTRNYVSYCPICGKLNDRQDDKRVKKLFPGLNIGTFGFFTMGLSGKGDFEDFEKWAEENYPLVVWKDFDFLKDKCIDLNLID